jgi:hypothetical protein
MHEAMPADEFVWRAAAACACCQATSAPDSMLYNAQHASHCVCGLQEGELHPVLGTEHSQLHKMAQMS